MKYKQFLRNLNHVHYNLPIGAVATSVGATTLSNIYALRELVYLKDIFMNIAALVALFALFKFIRYPSVVKKELNLPVLASIFPTFGMLIMILGSYYIKFNYEVGKDIWLMGILIYFILSTIVIYKHIIRKFNFNTFLPSFFIPFVGCLVSCVCGSNIEAQGLKQVIFAYGSTTYFILLPIMIYRIYKGGIDKQVYPTVAIMAAAPSLVIISYLNVFHDYNEIFIDIMGFIVLSMVVYAYLQVPKIMKDKFHAGFASLTFPFAASTLATFKISAYFINKNQLVSNMFEAIGTIEFFIATSLIGYVMYNLFCLLFHRLSKKDAIE